jgi:PAS domain S-box-containing protein
MHQKLNGEPIPCDITLIRVKYNDGFIVVGYTRDLRELKTMMAKMREADERNKIMLDAMPLSCSLIDKNMNLIDCNKEALNLFGISDKHEFLDKFFEFSPQNQPCGRPSKEKAIECINKAFQEGYCRFEWIHQKANGEQIPAEITLVRVKYGEEETVAGYIRDLREMKATLREMRKAEIAEENSKAKSKFLAAMSHEIRTPMNTILGITEVQLQDDTLAPDVKESLTEIYNSSDLLLGIINDILDLSKIEAGKMELAPSKYEVASLINDTAQLSVMRISSKPIEFELIVDENVPMVLLGDEMRIKQILNNLLSNAFKYTEEGTVKLQIYSEKKEENKDYATLVFRVSDTGQGMTAEQVNEIFDEYSRFNLEANRTIEGTGLGMNITQNLIHMMNGEISVDSALGVGTTFVVRLPQKIVGSDVIGKKIAQNLRQFRLDNALGTRKTQIVRELMPYGSVLVVDDVESNLYVARRLLSPYDLSIETVAGGAEAVKKIKNGRIYDIIFMDHMMPKMDGIETVKIIRGLGYRGTIIALTANAVAGQSEMFMDSGFDAFISKPIDLRQLNAVLNKFIRDKQPDEVIETARRQKVGIIKTAQIPPKSDTEMLSIFMRDAKKALAAFEAALKDIDEASGDNFQSFSSPAHAMKSVFANIGGTALSQMARELEKSAKENDKSGVESQTRDIIAVLKIITSAIKKELEKKTGGKDGDLTLLQEQLKIIGDACANYDEKTVAAAMSVLDSMIWTKETRDFLDKISEYILHSDFEKILQLLLAQKVI